MQIKDLVKKAQALKDEQERFFVRNMLRAFDRLEVVSFGEQRILDFFRTASPECKSLISEAVRCCIENLRNEEQRMDNLLVAIETGMDTGNTNHKILKHGIEQPTSGGRRTGAS